MPDRDAADRLRPSLIDRLHEGRSTVMPRLSAGGVMTTSDLRRAVKRDLEWLLNSTSLESAIDLSRWPLVRQSVLNYGMPDLAGATVSSVKLDELRAELKRVIVAFEPRINPASIEVRLSKSKSVLNSVAFEVQCEILAQPLPIAVVLRTDFSLESGLCEVRDSDREP